MIGLTSDELFARINSGGLAAWYLADRLGSVRDLVSASGAVIDHLDYDVFGNITSESSSSNGDRYKWTGRELDIATGLQYNRARVYDSSTGRFEAQDPVAFAGGDTNVYRYTHNNPANGTDPSGLVESGRTTNGKLIDWTNPLVGPERPLLGGLAHNPNKPGNPAPFDIFNVSGDRPKNPPESNPIVTIMYSKPDPLTPPALGPHGLEGGRGGRGLPSDYSGANIYQIKAQPNSLQLAGVNDRPGGSSWVLNLRWNVQPKGGVSLEDITSGRLAQPNAWKGGLQLQVGIAYGRPGVLPGAPGKLPPQGQDTHWWQSNPQKPNPWMFANPKVLPNILENKRPPDQQP